MLSSFDTYKKTKILATLGPNTHTEEMIKKLVQNGMNAVRLNFSHGTHADHQERINLIRKIEKELGIPITIVQDLQGPKIRLGNLVEEKHILTKGSSVTLFFGKDQVDASIPVSFDIFPYIKVGETIFINDGIIQLVVKELVNQQAICEVIAGGEIRSHKGLNLPTTTIPNASLTEKDKEDLAFGLENEVDYVAVSFVQSGDDIKHVKSLIAESKNPPKIISKIERATAVKNLESIIHESNAVMIARGDLAVEIGQEEVPIIQRTIIKLARQHNTPIIVATQMLESMIHNSEPTRAEVNDVATAVLEQVDAVMLSAETAIGNYPVEAVSMMDRIIRRVEAYYYETHKEYQLVSVEGEREQTTAIAAAASLLAHQLQAKMIFALTASGRTAMRIASYRPLQPIIGLADNISVYRQLSLVWGTIPFYLQSINYDAKAYAEIITTLQAIHKLEKHDKIVLVSGKHPGVAGHTNIINVTQVKDLQA